jgi:hypothetical protein
MAIIYQKDPSALIPQGNRTVSTFPSGLLRVEQSFVGRSNLQEFHRDQLQIGSDFPGDQSPSIDGLKIFPAVQEKQMADGFTEYFVTSYGRINTSGLITFEWKTYSEQGTFDGLQVTAIKRNKIKKIQRVYLESEVDSIVFDYSGVSAPELISGVEGNEGTPVYTVGVTSYESTKFGDFIEVTYVVDVYKLLELE